MSAGYPILGPPTMSLQTFSDILESAGSPAAPEAAGMYAQAIRYGVDPSVLLAVFQHESSFGKAGVARSTQSVGNLEYTPASASVGAVKAGRWAAYPSWTMGAADTAQLLASELYGRSAAYSTTATMPYRWAPASDGNNPAGYAAALAASIRAWTGRAPSVRSEPPSSSANTKAAAAAPHRVPAPKPASPKPAAQQNAASLMPSPATWIGQATRTPPAGSGRVGSAPVTVASATGPLLLIAGAALLVVLFVLIL